MYRRRVRPVGRGRQRLVAVGLVVLATASCGSSEENSETNTINNTMSSSSAPQPTTGRSPLLDEVRRAAAEHLGISPDEVEVGEAQLLSPECSAVPAWRKDILDAATVWFVRIDGGSLIRGGDDEALAEVAQRCFLDQGAMPDPGDASSLVLYVGPPRVVRPLDATIGPRVLEPFGVEWQPASVVATDDGFDISFYAENVETLKVFEVTSIITGGSASTEYRLVG